MIKQNNLKQTGVKSLANIKVSTTAEVIEGNVVKITENELEICLHAEITGSCTVKLKKVSVATKSDFSDAIEMPAEQFDRNITEVLLTATGMKRVAVHNYVPKGIYVRVDTETIGSTVNAKVHTFALYNPSEKPTR